MADNRLYSIAALAKILDMPESTLHYWKNRFDDVLPSFGTGRGKRYRAEAVAIFRDIGAMLAQGLSAGDVRSELARRYPVNVGSGEAKSPAAPLAATAAVAPDAQTMLAVASAIGAEIARTLAEQLTRGGLSGPAALPEAAAAAIQGELAQARAENAALADKMRVLESELVRLRKDRRELENHLLGKIKALGEERGNG